MRGMARLMKKKEKSYLSRLLSLISIGGAILAGSFQPAFSQAVPVPQSDDDFSFEAVMDLIRNTVDVEFFNTLLFIVFVVLVAIFVITVLWAVTKRRKQKKRQEIKERSQRAERQQQKKKQAGLSLNSLSSPSSIPLKADIDEYEEPDDEDEKEQPADKGKKSGVLGILSGLLKKKTKTGNGRTGGSKEKRAAKGKASQRIRQAIQDDDSESYNPRARRRVSAGNEEDGSSRRSMKKSSGSNHLLLSSLSERRPMDFDAWAAQQRFAYPIWDDTAKETESRSERRSAKKSARNTDQVEAKSSSMFSLGQKLLKGKKAGDAEDTSEDKPSRSSRTSKERRNEERGGKSAGSRTGRRGGKIPKNKEPEGFLSKALGSVKELAEDVGISLGKEKNTSPSGRTPKARLSQRMNQVLADLPEEVSGRKKGNVIFEDDVKKKKTFIDTEADDFENEQEPLVDEDDDDEFVRPISSIRRSRSGSRARTETTDTEERDDHVRGRSAKKADLFVFDDDVEEDAPVKKAPKEKYPEEEEYPEEEYQDEEYQDEEEMQEEEEPHVSEEDDYDSEVEPDSGRAEMLSDSDDNENDEEDDRDNDEETDILSEIEEDEEEILPEPEPVHKKQQENRPQTLKREDIRSRIRSESSYLLRRDKTEPDSDHSQPDVRETTHREIPRTAEEVSQLRSRLQQQRKNILRNRSDLALDGLRSRLKARDGEQTDGADSDRRRVPSELAKEESFEKSSERSTKNNLTRRVELWEDAEDEQISADQEASSQGAFDDEDNAEDTGDQKRTKGGKSVSGTPSVMPADNVSSLEELIQIYGDPQPKRQDMSDSAD